MAFLAAVLAISVGLIAAGPASAATASATETRVGASDCTAQVVIRPHAGITAGQRLGNNPVRPGADELRTITGLFAKRAATLMTITVADGASVVVTEEHPFYVLGVGWVISGDLRVGDRLAQRDGGSTAITWISTRPASTTVYNFTVDGDHDYYVTDAQLLVHNCPTSGSAGAADTSASAAGSGLARTLTAAEQRSVASLQRQVAAHTEKLEAYRANPDAFDNLGYLERAPSPAIRQRIIDGRINHLETEIRGFQDQIDKLLGGG